MNLNQFYFSKPEKFNDPFDFNTNFIITDQSEENFKVAFDLLRKRFTGDDRNGKTSTEYFDKNYLTNGVPNKNFEKLLIGKGNEGIKELYARMGVTCFSACKDDILMWSHYSSNHEGFCLKFDTSYAPFHHFEPPLTYSDATLHPLLIQVKYVKEYPKISLGELNENDGFVQTLFPLAKRKWKNWRYEQEWRILSWVGDITYPYNPSALCAIYLGYRTSKENEEKIRKFIGENPIREDGSKKMIYRMQLSETEYKVIPIEI